MLDIQFDSSRLKQAHDLFMLGDSSDTLITSLEGLGVELGNRCRTIGQAPNLRPEIRNYLERTEILSEAINYASERLTEVLVRHEEINWKKEVLSYEANPDVRALASDPHFLAWQMFMGLSIKDFHLDIGSLMDALAPVVIQTESKLKAKDRKSSPGWADIQNKGSERSPKFRLELSGDLLEIVDSTDRWWPSTKKVRDLLAHRKHNRIVFGHSKDGLLFQIYDQSRHPRILLPEVLYRQGHNVVDFDLYSAFILTEVLILFDDLGKAIAPKLQIINENISRMFLRVVNKPVSQSIERLMLETS